MKYTVVQKHESIDGYMNEDNTQLSIGDLQSVVAMGIESKNVTEQLLVKVEREMHAMGDGYLRFDPPT